MEKASSSDNGIRTSMWSSGLINQTVKHPAASGIINGHDGPIMEKNKQCAQCKGQPEQSVIIQRTLCGLVVNDCEDRGDNAQLRQAPQKHFVH